MPARRLLIDKVHNLRELGGYGTLEGEETRFGRFLRGDLPNRAGDTGVKFLLDYGLRTVIDLRTPGETAEEPCIFAGVSGVQYHNIGFAHDLSILGDLLFCPKDHYVPVVKGRQGIGKIFNAMAQAGPGAILFHCSAGKDRTGMVAAMLLLLAGVPRVDVQADYQVTFTYIKEIIDEKKGDPRRDTALSRTEAEWLEPFLDYIDIQGGVEGFLLAQGVSRQAQQTLRQRLLAE